MNFSILIFENGDLVARRISKILGCIIGNAKVCTLAESKAEQKYEHMILVFGNEDLEVVRQVSEDLKVGRERFGVEDITLVEYGRHPQFELYFSDMMDSYYFLSSVEGAYELGGRLRERFSKQGKQMEKEKLLHVIEDFLVSHNTGALATGIDKQVRGTPIEYLYWDGYLYLITEGGYKFNGLLRNENISFVIFEPYTSMSTLKGLQIKGKARLLDQNSELYGKVFERRGYPAGFAGRLAIDMHMIQVQPVQYEILCSDLKKEGYDSKQILIVNENHSR